MKELTYKIAGADEELTVKFNPPLVGDITYHHEGDTQSIKCGGVTALKTTGIHFVIINVIN